MNAPAAHSARLHAATAALCALLLLAALCVMALHHAPWWALCGVQGALLGATAHAGLWLERWRTGRLMSELERLRAAGGALWWADLERAQNGRQRRLHAGTMRPEDDDDVFWQERMPRPHADEGKEH